MPVKASLPGRTVVGSTSAVTVVDVLWTVVGATIGEVVVGVVEAGGVVVVPPPPPPPGVVVVVVVGVVVVVLVAVVLVVVAVVLVLVAVVLVVVAVVLVVVAVVLVLVGVVLVLVVVSPGHPWLIVRLPPTPSTDAVSVARSKNGEVACQDPWPCCTMVIGAPLLTVK
jgi:hypothetical protein